MQKWALSLLAATLAIFTQPANQAFAIPGPKSVGTVTPSPAPTLTPPPHNECCFCVYPSEGERDHEALGALCGKCLESAFSGCTVSEIFSAKDFTPKAIKKYNCEGAINQLNIQHGPKNYVTSQVRVCKTAYPGCSINFNDASCATFQDEKKARKYIDEVRRLWKGPAEIKLCASRSINFPDTDCSFIRQEITYNISNSGATEDLGECPPPGSICTAEERKGADQKEFRCRNSGSIFTQECCLTSPGKSSIFRKYGVWGPLGGGCKLEPCSDKSCPTYSKCEGSRSSAQSCMPITGSTGETSYCKKLIQDCALYNQQCVSNGKVSFCGEACDPETCPSKSWCENGSVVRQGCNKVADPKAIPANCETSDKQCPEDKWMCVIEDGEAVCRGGVCNEDTCPKRPECRLSTVGSFRHCDETRAGAPRCEFSVVACRGSELCKVIDNDVVCVPRQGFDQ